MSVVIETTIGEITVDLFLEERPVACMNFIKLCKLKYYNFNLFHTIEQGFIAQTGDPTGAGDGGSSVWGVVEGPSKRFFEAESLPKIKHSTPGLISLVSVGRHMVGSQFFFTLAADLTSLDGVHCVFGEVVEGHETLRKLNEAIVDEKFRPFQDIRITHTVILDDPYPDPRGFRVPSRSPSPSEERMANGRIGADEDVDDAGGKTFEEVQEMMEEREAKARATILEIVGDIPSADIAPPENVLFVCKLNPITTDDDLEIIFSRFGKVKNCEVIRDRKTGDSLQYAFVEFSEKSACEAAYFKMDNVLIDDRRIHVDFSQSVAKVKWRGKGRGVDGVEGRLDFNDLKSSESDRSSRKPRLLEDAHKNLKKEIHTMTSEERRKAREERHRALERKEREEHLLRSRSRDKRYFSDKQRYRSTDKRYENNGRDRRKSREHSPRKGSDRERTSRSRPRERERGRLQGRKQEYRESERTEKSTTEKHTTCYAQADNKKKNKQLRKQRKESSSSDLSTDSSESDSSTSSDSSSTTTSSSTTVSSSSEDRYRRKKRTGSRKKRKSKVPKKHIKKR